MTIGINGNEANVEHRVGVGQYAYGLISHLAKLQSVQTKFTVYLRDKPLPDLPKPTENWRYEIIRPRKLWMATALQRKLIQERAAGKAPSVFFSATHYGPLFMPVPLVISIMDMSFEKFPQYFKKRDYYQLKYWTWWSAQVAKKILTISQFSKDEICKTYGFDGPKVVVTYPGFDKERFNAKVSSKSPKVGSLVKKYHLEVGYFAFLGTLQPRKNVERLIEAFAQLSRHDLKLVIVGMIKEGRGGWMYQPVFDKVKALHLDKKVVFTGYLPDEEIPYLFKGSLAYVLPSLYEGFGIPAVEAMATGVPVVVSKVSSLPEICGEAPIYIADPYSVADIQAALEKVLSMRADELVKRVNLGLSWVKRYNWEETAKKTLEVLYEAAQR